MGASLGNWEFLSQTNDNADCIPEQDRFKFVNDFIIIIEDEIQVVECKVQQTYNPLEESKP